mmetsp:Transcript_11253/g.16592  ORF Transcript_11253/g.16592 Transcript_11253/m.16592 type:complete len:668 (+) Transcript_11253:160-2163(+)
MILMLGIISISSVVFSATDQMMENDVTKEEEIVISTHHWTVDDDLNNSGGIRWRNIMVRTEPVRRYNKDNKNERRGEGGDANDDYVDDGSYLLHPSSGFVKNGHICGILGPSGAGKSTLLAALSGHTLKSSNLHIHGSVWLEEEMDGSDILEDGTEQNSKKENIVKRYLSTTNGEVALLSQHDTFFTMLTPYETLQLAAYLQLGGGGGDNIVGGGGDNDQNVKHSKNFKQRNAVVQKVMESLGLWNVRHRTIGDRTHAATGGGGAGAKNKGKMESKRGGGAGSGGGLSGGEKRRLSVALELISAPKVFLADEPTTGLDSSQAHHVVNLMARLANERNIPCICSLHQPRTSIWKTLDSFILLAPGGKMIYMGERQDATDYFASLGFRCPPETNPAEYFIDLVSIDTEDTDQAAIDMERINYLSKEFRKKSHRDICNNLDDDANNNEENVWSTPLSSSLSITKNTKRMGGHHVRPNFVGRFSSIFLRSLRQNLRNTRVNVIRLVGSIGQAVLFSSIFKRVRDGVPIAKGIADRTALLSFGVINMSMMALMKTLDLFGREIAVVTRERMRKQYSSFEYLLSKALAELPIDAFFSVVFAGVLKMTTGLRCSMPVLTGTYALMTVAGELSCFLENHVVACILQTVMPPFGCSMFNYLQMLGYETILFLLLLS